MTPMRPAREAGFTLVEILITLAVSTGLILAVLALFDYNNKVARVQTQITDMQQSLRIGQYDMVRMVRMAGRGGLPAVQPALQLPTGVAVAVRNNVAANQYIVPGDSTTPQIVPGTDVLTVRGVFTDSVFQVNHVSGTSFTLTSTPANNPATATGGTIHLCEKTTSGVSQEAALDELRKKLGAPTGGAKPRNEALILVSPLNDSIYGVVQLNPGASLKTSTQCDPTDPTAGVTLSFLAGSAAMPTAYRALSSSAVGENLPATLTRVAYVGVLEEYRFYVRLDRAVPADPTSDLTPKLSRAQFYPGTNTPYVEEPTNLQADVADNILDLQVSLGMDVNNNLQIAEGATPVAKQNDEWLFNASGEPVINGRLYSLRITALARTDRRDTSFQAPILNSLEDRVYTTSATDVVNGRTERMYRRRLLQTIVDLRNL